jgi:nucleoside-diphosphate kinase
MERTFAIIKPAAVAAGNTGAIISMIEKSGFSILTMEKRQLKPAEVEQFYAIHKARPFFGEMVTNMTEGPVVLMALEKENAVKAWRDLMGATDPKQAAPGTVRKLFGTDIGHNAVHGSDSIENAAIELKQFFPNL